MRPAPPAIDLGLESTVWDLDDDLVDPAAAQLNVAVPMKEKDDVPWPHGRTPAGQELDVPGSEVERALGLSPASGWLTAPLYFWSARGALRRLRGEATDAEVRLEEAEAARDRLLGELAGALRSKLDGSDRFRAPYDRIDQHVRIAAEARSSVAHADTQSESGLSQVDVELESAKATVTLRTRDAAERRALAEGGQRDLARLRAAHQRHLIERRNVVSRAQETAGPGSEMPPELAGRFLAVEEQIKRAEAELGTLTETQKQLDTRLRAAEDEERQALAHVRRIEGKREGLILAHQGTLGDLNDTLRTAEQGLARALADVGLAIVELHGEVPVDEGVRRQVLECDKSVLARALELERLRRAAESVDVEAYQRGRMVLIGALALSVLLVGWLAVA